jgi:hypothetical protein
LMFPSWSLRTTQVDQIHPCLRRASRSERPGIAAAGTESIYKIYGESFNDHAHLDAVHIAGQRTSRWLPTNS